MTMNPTSETELYGPIRDLLLERGYEVQAEVEHCDVVGRDGDQVVVVELKVRFSVELLAQGSERLGITDLVYLGIPAPKRSVRGRSWKRNRKLLRRLGLGLMVVKLGDSPEVDVVLHPTPYQPRKSKVRKRAVLREMEGRSGDHNVGGSTGTTLITAYREDAVLVACALFGRGEQTAAKLRKLGTPDRTRRIMYDNHYGWFDRLGQGLYRLTESGEQALEQYPQLAETCRSRLEL
jgi:hypothetical protein